MRTTKEYDFRDRLTAISSSNPQLLSSFLWGLDLSGSPQGAGGVGGLLAVSDQSTINSQPSTHFVSYDGNGNVAAFVNASDGTVSANYEYGPFGELIRASGQMANANPLRFSTKYQDDETDLLYYRYRHYSASMGKSLARDPLSELGSALLRQPASTIFSAAEPLLGIDFGALQRAAMEQGSLVEQMQLYALNKNDSVDFVDPVGLMRYQDLRAKLEARARANASIDCCCVSPKISGSIAGFSQGGAAVLGYYSKEFTDVFFFNKCVFDPQIYWWDCYSASWEGGWSWNWGDYGWSGPGSWNYQAIYSPNPWSLRDPYHLAMLSLYVWDECVDGKRRTKWKTTNGLKWTWNKKTQEWTGPEQIGH
jgi:RHS repeat-associated protein